ncbi:MAG: hypothetical protein AB7O38_29445 [Pirellulaceae bacterium]
MLLASLTKYAFIGFIALLNVVMGYTLARRMGVRPRPLPFLGSLVLATPISDPDAVIPSADAAPKVAPGNAQ